MKFWIALAVVAFILLYVAIGFICDTPFFFTGCKRFEDDDNSNDNDNSNTKGDGSASESTVPTSSSEIPPNTDTGTDDPTSSGVNFNYFGNI